MIMSYVANRLRDELLKTAAVSFVAASASAAGQYAVHWAVNRRASASEPESKETNESVEQTE